MPRIKKPHIPEGVGRRRRTDQFPRGLPRPERNPVRPKVPGTKDRNRMDNFHGSPNLWKV